MYTRESRIRALLDDAGVAYEPTSVSAALEDASYIVDGFDFWIRGAATSDTSGTLVDTEARFSGTVEVGARVVNLDRQEAGYSVFESTVSVVDSNTQLTLASALDFIEGETYAIEDLKRYELAERYKAAALLVSRGEGGRFTGGDTREELGPITVVRGVGGEADEGVANLFEAEFLKIVGVAHAVV